jgi:hypothetical protein
MHHIEPPLDFHFGRSPIPLSLRRYEAIPDEGMNRFDLQRRVPELTPACWIKLPFRSLNLEWLPKRPRKAEITAISAL